MSDYSLDSPLVTEECMPHILDEARAVLQVENPEPDEVYNLIEQLDDTDFVRSEFCVLMPTIVGVMETDPARYRDAVCNFCHKLTKDIDSPVEAYANIRAAYRDRISAMVLKALADCTRERYDRFDFHILVAGIAANYGHPDLGIEITRLYDSE